MNSIFKNGIFEAENTTLYVFKSKESRDRFFGEYPTNIDIDNVGYQLDELHFLITSTKVNGEVSWWLFTFNNPIMFSVTDCCFKPRDEDLQNVRKVDPRDFKLSDKPIFIDFRQCNLSSFLSKKKPNKKKLRNAMSRNLLS